MEYLIMKERHKNWSREMSKSFILKSPSNKKNQIYSTEKLKVNELYSLSI